MGASAVRSSSSWTSPDAGLTRQPPPPRPDRGPPGGARGSRRAMVLSEDGDHPMTKISDTQAVILSAAAQRDDGAVLPLPETLKIKGGAAEKVLGSLKAKGLIDHQGIPRGDDPPPLRITRAGVSRRSGSKPRTRTRRRHLRLTRARRRSMPVSRRSAPRPRRPAPTVRPRRRRKASRPRARRGPPRLRRPRSPRRAPAPSRRG